MCIHSQFPIITIDSAAIDTHVFEGPLTMSVEHLGSSSAKRASFRAEGKLIRLWLHRLCFSICSLLANCMRLSVTIWAASRTLIFPSQTAVGVRLCIQ
jgi:hypothetical protein